MGAANSLTVIEARGQSVRSLYALLMTSSSAALVQRLPTLWLQVHFVPVAAATIGRALGVLAPGEDAALLLGALVTVGVTTAASSLAARRPPERTNAFDAS